MFHGERVAFTNSQGERRVGKAFSQNPEYVNVFVDDNPPIYRENYYGIPVSAITELGESD